MAHKLIDDKVVVDWTTGDPEGDRITLLAAYKDLIDEIMIAASNDDPGYVTGVLKKWNVSTNNQVDDTPRIWIKRPEA